MERQPISQKTIDMNAAFTASFSGWGSAPDPLGKRQQGATQQMTEFYSQLSMSHERIALMTEQPCTVINLNPYPLMVLHPLFDGLNIPANKEGQDFAAYVIRSVKYQVNQGLDHNHMPVEFWPVQLAKEFSDRYADKGGVFYISGNLEENPELAKTAEFKEKLAEADKRLIAYCRHMKQTADNEWATPNRAGVRNIHEPHRRAAKILFGRRLLTKLPDWMDSVVMTPEPDCPICKAEPKKGAVVCPSCGHCLNPKGAYEAGIITESNVALERLTRAEVESLGISAFVAETRDEKPARLAAKRSKPLSEFDLAQRAEGQTAAAEPAKKSKPATETKA